MVLKGAPMLIVGSDRVEVERQLVSGPLSCPDQPAPPLARGTRRTRTPSGPLSYPGARISP